MNAETRKAIAGKRSVMEFIRQARAEVAGGPKVAPMTMMEQGTLRDAYNLAREAETTQVANVLRATGEA